MISLYRRYLLLFLVSIFLWSCSAEEDLPPNERPLGTSARDFLRDTRYTSLSVEILYVGDFAPEASVVPGVKSFLTKYLNKPEGITVSTRAIEAPGVGTYSIEEVTDIEDVHRTEFSSGSKLAAFIFIADDRSVSSSSIKDILGKAYRNTSIVIFGKEVREESDEEGIPEDDLTLTTIKHEFGHLFGLVNNGTEALTPHEDEDPAKQKHCNVAGCLMNAQLDFMNFGAGLDFGEQCHADLQANGGR